MFLVVEKLPDYYNFPVIQKITHYSDRMSSFSDRMSRQLDKLST